MRSFLIFVLFISLISCHQHSDDEASHDHSEESAQETEMEEGLHLTQTQMDNIGLRYETIQKRNIRSLVKLNGRIELPADGIAIATSPLAGQIQKVHILPGDRIRKGATLFTLRNMELIDWQEQLLKAREELTFLDGEIKRQTYLTDEKISPVRTLEELKSRRNRMMVEVNAIQQRLSIAGVSEDSQTTINPFFDVKAPQSGVIQHVNVHQGSYVTPETEMVRIVSQHHLRIHLAAFENDITQLAKGQVIQFFVQSRPKALNEARIVWINQVVNMENNSYEIHADIIGDKSSLSPGEYVEARVINQESEVSTLPLEAITYDKGLTYIFIRTSDEGDESHFERIQVRLGESDLGFVEILPIDPLPDDALVVTNGAFFLMAQTKKDEGGGGHDH